MSGLAWHREELSRTEIIARWWQMGSNGFLLEGWIGCYHGRACGYTRDAETDSREDQKQMIETFRRNKRMDERVTNTEKRKLIRERRDASRLVYQFVV